MRTQNRNKEEVTVAKVIHFAPRADLDAQANLDAFVYVCREKLTVFGADLPFESDTWNLSSYINLKATRTTLRILFSSWETAQGRASQSMREPFLSFAKSFVRFQHAMRPTRAIGQRIAALRALEAALVEEGSASPVHARQETFYRAAQLAQDRFTPAVAYRVGVQLEAISTFLNEKRLVSVPSRWHNPIKRPRSDSARVGKEFDERRRGKLPSPAALNALATAFRVASSPKDLVATSVAAILCSAPDRINEVLLLEEHCEVTQRSASAKEAEYGLRWRPSKGADPMVKWVVRSMADVVREAVSRLRRVSEPAREVARWYEKHPHEMFLPPSLECQRTRARITMDQLAQVLFVDGSSNTARVWCKSKEIEIVGRRGHQSASFAEVERAVLAMLPFGFPIVDADLGLRYSQMLCVVRKNELNEKATYRCVVEQVSQGQIYACLSGGVAKADRSVFARLGLYEDDGKVVKIASHQLRHYLNTLAQIGGLSQLDIAKWSGRRDVKQNSVYDHESSRDVAEHMRRISGEEYKPVGPIARLRAKTLIPRDEFARLKIPTAHSTEFGFCVHDFTMTPCQIHRDCINCDEQVCIKGDAVREHALRRHRDETRALLACAESGQSEGLAGADRWVQHQRLTLKRLDQLCEILDDPQVPDGALIQPSGVVPVSRIEQAKVRRLTLSHGNRTSDVPKWDKGQGATKRGTNEPSKKPNRSGRGGDCVDPGRVD